MVAILGSLFVILVLHFTPASTAPVSKRVAQVIADATRDWEQACLAAGGGQQCNPLSIAAFSSLLAAPGACDQQNAADNMIDLAKQLGNDAEMIRLTQLYRQQPRNAPDSLSVLYCQTAPRNKELSGLFQCQFAGVKADTFTGGRAVGAAGTIPFGLNAPLSPAGSCPASKTPIPDGQQLNKLVKNPIVTGGAVTSKPTTAVTTAAPKPTTSTAQTTAIPSSSAVAGGAKPFTVQNGLDAQALNAKFAQLSPNALCTNGEQACVRGGFAQCVGTKFIITSCAGGTGCFVLPLVNSRGTSITCTTPADAQARISTAIGSSVAVPAASSVVSTAAPGKATSTKATSTKVTTATSAPVATAPASGNTGFAVLNGQDAQALNAKFATLTPTSPCTPGENACVKGGFAQCVAGKFVISSCGGALSCFVLPLVNSRGTSITCTTPVDAQARISAALGSAVAAPSAVTRPPTTTATRPPAASSSSAAAPATSSAAAGNAKPFTLQNGLDAQALNRKFAALSANSGCSAGENACLNGGFAQCVSGRFVVTGCAGGLSCFGLPLVNSAGTSITCTTPEDAAARIAATGASGRVTGR